MSFKKKRGFALSIVLWIVASLLAGIAFFLIISKDSLALTSSLNDKLIARLEAQSFLEILKFFILTADYDSISLKNSAGIKGLPKRVIVDGREYKTGSIKFYIRDVSMLVNTFRPNYILIARLFTKGSDRELFFTMRDSLKDWVDEDNIVSLNGAESSFYKLKKEKNYGCRNNLAVQDEAELAIVNGFSLIEKDEFMAFKEKYLYNSVNMSFPNLALIDKDYLKIILELSELESKKLLSYKEEDFYKFKKAIMQYSSYNDDWMGFSIANQYVIKINSFKGMAKVDLSVLIDFNNIENDKIIIESYVIN